MSSAIGLYIKDKFDHISFVSWISRNSELGMFLVRIYDIPSLHKISFNEITKSFDTDKSEEYLALDTLDTAINEIEKQILRYERDAVLKAMLEKGSGSYEELKEDYQIIAEDYQILGALNLISSFLNIHSRVLLAIS